MERFHSSNTSVALGDSYLININEKLTQSCIPYPPRTTAVSLRSTHSPLPAPSTRTDRTNNILAR